MLGMYNDFPVTPASRDSGGRSDSLAGSINVLRKQKPNFHTGVEYCICVYFLESKQDSIYQQ